MTAIPTLTEILIAGGVGLVVAVALRLYRARSAARKAAPLDAHAALIKRAERYTAESSFLRTVCSQYRASGHMSERQAAAVAKALARLEAQPSRTGRAA